MQNRPRNSSYTLVTFYFDSPTSSLDALDGKFSVVFLREFVFADDGTSVSMKSHEEQVPADQPHDHTEAFVVVFDGEAQLGWQNLGNRSHFLHVVAF